MFKNYFKTAIRNLTRNKLYSFINILGLTLGLTACLLVTTVVLNDLSYDRQWTNSKELYRIVSINNHVEQEKRFSLSFSGLGPSLKQNFPEVKNYCRMVVNKSYFRMGKNEDKVKIKYLMADTSVWSLLDFNIIEGNPQKFVAGYSNLVISESLKKKYFPHTDPVGKTIEQFPEFGDKQPFLITGVIKDLPSNSHFYAQALVLNLPYPGENELHKSEYGTFLPQYILLKHGTDIHPFTQKVNTWYQHFIGNGDKIAYSFAFQPIYDIHLYPDFAHDPDTGGSMRTVYIFSGVAILLLLIACINFVNLTTARTLKRLKETGIRKVLGAGKRHLIAQFLFESLIFFFISFIFAIVLYSLFIGGVENFMGHPLALSLLRHIGLLAISGGIILMVSLFTGLYPALLLSRPRAISIIKGNPFKNLDTGFLRKILITGQFILSVILIIAMIVVRLQLHFLNHKDLGYDKNNLLRTSLVPFGAQRNTFKQEVMKIPGVESASITQWTPGMSMGGNMSTVITDPLDTTRKIKANYISGDIDLASTLKLKLVKGRLFDPHLSTDVLNADSLMQKDFAKFEEVSKTRPVLITAYTARVLGVEQLNKPYESIQGIPVGIVENFNNESLRESLKPCIIRAIASPKYGEMLIRINQSATKEVLQKLNHLWQQFYPNKVLQTDWISDILTNQYKTETRLEQLFIFFGSLSIFLACLGLFGLIAFSSEQRTKEIGIRKVLGASVANVVALLSKDFLKLVIIAIIISIPIAWLAMNKWLQNFAYRINISWWIFVVAGLLAIIIALITVSFQAIKAARANPVKSLRSE